MTMALANSRPPSDGRTVICWPSRMVAMSSGGQGEIRPHHGQVDDDVKFALLALASDQPAELDARSGCGPDRRAQELLVQRFVRLFRQVSISLAVRPSANSFCRMLSSLIWASLTVRRVRRNSFSVRSGLQPASSGADVQGLLQVVDQPRSEIFALGIGDFAALDHRDHLACLDPVAQALAQLGHRSDSAPHPRDVIGIGNQRARRQEVTLERTAATRASVMPASLIWSPSRSTRSGPCCALSALDVAAVAASGGLISTTRPSVPERRDDNEGEADKNAGEEDDIRFMCAFPQAPGKCRGLLRHR